MTNVDLHNLLLKLRDAQKAYFRNREASDLQEARKYERILDDYLTRYEYGMTEPLFEGQGHA